MPAELNTILRLRVPVVVRIGTKQVSLDHVLSLGPGAILELDKSAEEDLDLLVNNRPIGTGKAVKVGENFGIRISEVRSAAKRVEAMGQT